MEKNNITNYISENKDRFLNELLDLLKIPSISADKNYQADVLKTADSIKTRLIEAEKRSNKPEKSPNCFPKYILSSKLFCFMLD